MKRSFLSALGLEKAVADQIMDEYGQAIEAVKEKAKEDFEKKADKLNKTVEALQSENEKLKTDGSAGDEWKTKYEALQTKFDAYKESAQKEFDDYKAGVEAEKAVHAKQSVLRRQLQSDGANADYIDLLELKFNLAEIELDGEKIKGWDEISKPVKERYPGMFGKVETVGANAANPPNGGYSGNPFKKETFNLQMQAEMFRKDPAHARQLALAAGIRLPL